jgi:hypothetical protein
MAWPPHFILTPCIFNRRQWAFARLFCVMAGDILRLVGGAVQVFQKDKLIMAWPDLDTRSHNQALAGKIK